MTVKTTTYASFFILFSLSQCMEINTHHNDKQLLFTLRTHIIRNNIDEIKNIVKNNKNIANTPIPICTPICDEPCLSHNRYEYPLHIALQEEKFYYASPPTREVNPTIITLLLANGASPNQPYVDGKTMPLHVAVKREKHSIIKLLLTYNANKNSLDEDGKTAYALALERDYGIKTCYSLCPNDIKQKKIIRNCMYGLGIVLIFIIIYDYIR